MLVSEPSGSGGEQRELRGAPPMAARAAQPTPLPNPPLLGHMGSFLGTQGAPWPGFQTLPRLRSAVLGKTSQPPPEPAQAWLYVPPRSSNPTEDPSSPHHEGQHSPQEGASLGPAVEL